MEFVGDAFFNFYKFSLYFRRTCFFVSVGVMILSVRKGKESGLAEKYRYNVENIEVKRMYICG
jgi:hypothetical protein